MASGDTKTGQLLDALENGGDISNIVGCCNTNLQNYLIESIDSVNDAKEEIAEKGGTVGDTGLSGLASEIASIPTGGGNVPIGDYGKVAYYTKLSFVVENIMEMGCNAEVIDPSKLASFAEGGSVELLYEDGSWQVGWGGGDTYTTAEVESEIGVRITNIVDNFAEVHIQGTSDVDITSERKECTIDTLQDFGEFYTDSSSSVTLPNGDTIVPDQIVGYILGSEVTSIGDNFMNACSNFSSFDASLATGLTTIGNLFLANLHKLTGELSLPTVTSVGNQFLHYTHFTSIKLPNLVTAGDNFIAGTWIQSLPSLPHCTTIGDYFCVDCSYLTSATLSSIPLLETLGREAFEQCKILTTISLTGIPNITSIGQGFASYCNGTTNVSFPSSDISSCFQASDTKSFSASSTSSVSYTVGMATSGSSTNIKNKFPNKGTYPYRKWR